MPVNVNNYAVRVGLNPATQPPMLVKVGGALNQRPTFLNLTDGANVIIDASKGERFYLSTSLAAVTLSPPINPDFNTEPMTLAFHNQSGAGSQLTLASGTGGFKFTQALPVIGVTPDTKVDFFTFIYLSQKDTWFLVGQAREI